jgi:hypothetical protein
MGAAAKIGRQIREAISKTIGDVMTRATENLRDATPKDTTHASKNWIPSTGTPYVGVDGSQEAPSDAAQEAGLAALKTYDVARDGKVFIVNNVDYIEYLDDKGEAEGFVAGALHAAAEAAPAERRDASRRLLTGMAVHAYRRSV